MNLIKILREKLHVCFFYKPIASQYAGFGTRNIIYECDCGKRKRFKVYRNFGEGFPIKTNNFISDEEMQEILTNNQNKNGNFFN